MKSKELGKKKKTAYLDDRLSRQPDGSQQVKKSSKI
jgi:hypothetical protein